MNCVPFKFKHFSDLIKMLKEQNCSWTKTVNFQTLPKIGYIVFIGKTPLAAGFLRRVEGGYGQLDTFVTNPMFGKIMRHEAINMVVDNLMEDALNLDMQGILAITEDQGIAKRAGERGFTVINQVLLGYNQNRR